MADAIAVDRLIKALTAQSQLETVEVAFGGAILPSQEEMSDFTDSDEEAEMEAEAEEEADHHREVCNVTAQMFHPAWTSVCKFMENSHMFRLRYSTGRNMVLALSRPAAND